VISSSQRPLPNNTQHAKQTNIRASGGIRTHNLSRRAPADLRLRQRGHWGPALSVFTFDFCTNLEGLPGSENSFTRNLWMFVTCLMCKTRAVSQCRNFASSLIFQCFYTNISFLGTLFLTDGISNQSRKPTTWQADNNGFVYHTKREEQRTRSRITFLWKFRFSIWTTAEMKIAQAVVATRDGLDGPIGSRWPRDFAYLSRLAMTLTHPPLKWVPGHFPGVKRPGRGVNHPPHMAPRLKIEKCCNSNPPPLPSWQVFMSTLPFFTKTKCWKVIGAPKCSFKLVLTKPRVCT
jgi:hypothetical protein